MSDRTSNYFKVHHGRSWYVFFDRRDLQSTTSAHEHALGIQREKGGRISVFRAPSYFGDWSDVAVIGETRT